MICVNTSPKFMAWQLHFMIRIFLILLFSLIIICPICWMSIDLLWPPQQTAAAEMSDNDTDNEERGEIFRNYKCWSFSSFVEKFTFLGTMKGLFN